MEEEKSDIRWKVENIVSFRLSDKNKKIKIKKMATLWLILITI